MNNNKPIKKERSKNNQEMAELITGLVWNKLNQGTSRGEVTSMIKDLLDNKYEEKE